MDCKKSFAKLQKMKNTQSEMKPIKIGKRPGITYCFGCKDYTQNFRPQEIKMTNKVLREKYHCFKFSISKYKSIFAKGYTPNWSEEVFVVRKIKNTVPWTYVVSDVNGEEITGRFYKK